MVKRRPATPDERQGVALILDELRGRQVPRAAELRRVDDRPRRCLRSAPSTATSCDPRPAVAAPIFAPKASSSYWSVITVAPSTAVRPAIDSIAAIERLLPVPIVPPFDVLPHQVGELRVRRHHGVGDRLDDRSAPRLAARGHDEQRAAAAVLPHRHGQLHEHVDALQRELGAWKPISDVSSGGQSGRLDARSSTTLIRSPSSTSTLTNLPASVRRCLTTSRPGSMTSSTNANVGSVFVVPHTLRVPPSRHTPRCTSRPLDRRRQLRERGRVRRPTAARRSAGTWSAPAAGTRANLRDVALLAPEAGPERRVDNRFDRRGVRHDRRPLRAAPAPARGDDGSTPTIVVATIRAAGYAGSMG